MRLLKIVSVAVSVSLLSVAPRTAWSREAPTQTGFAVGAQYDTTHVYVAPDEIDRFVESFLATFGGKSTKQVVATVTPTPSSTTSQLLLTPAGSVSVFGFKTPIPYPFGHERTGYLVTDIDAAVKAAQSAGADVLVKTFPDPIGRDVVVQWPGGINMQLYWHTAAPSYAELQTIPENRVYLPAGRADQFVKSFVAFSKGSVVSDTAKAPGIEIGRPDDTYRRVRITSKFGKMTVLVTDGVLPYPYGHELTGYEVPSLDETLAKAKTAGVAVLVEPYVADARRAALVKFPGGYVAEIHSAVGK
jgi:predicted enzyme related to lactoylglutathione lyase